MRRIVIGATVLLAACGLAQAKGKAAQKDNERQEAAQEPMPAYKPFPHNFIFNLKELNGKPVSADVWIRIDSTMRGSGFSGCKSWSGVFVVGPNRLGPKAMPAVADAKCDPAQQEIEREFWQVLRGGPYWDTQGSDFILKGVNGGVLRFSRSL